jgi:chemotaxis protein MotB
MASLSISALLARNAQLEREALESEARVAELEVLRGSMERRLRLLEQQQMASTAQRPMGANVPTPAVAPAKSEPVQGKSSKKADRR